MSKTSCKVAYLEVRILELETEAQACRNFVLNNELIQKAGIIDKMVEALRKQHHIEMHKLTHFLKGD